jgi:hypothetical protein
MPVVLERAALDPWLDPDAGLFGRQMALLTLPSS